MSEGLLAAAVAALESLTIFIRALPLASLELVVLRLNHGTNSLEADEVTHLALARRRVHVRLIKDVVTTTATCYTPNELK